MTFLSTTGVTPSVFFLSVKLSGAFRAGLQKKFSAIFNYRLGAVNFSEDGMLQILPLARQRDGLISEILTMERFRERGIRNDYD